MDILSEDIKKQLVKTTEDIIADGFTPKPGWNFPSSQITKRVATIKAPDNLEDIEILVIVQRVDHDD